MWPLALIETWASSWLGLASAHLLVLTILTDPSSGPGSRGDGKPHSLTQRLQLLGVLFASRRILSRPVNYLRCFTHGLASRSRRSRSFSAKSRNVISTA